MVERDSSGRFIKGHKVDDSWRLKLKQANLGRKQPESEKQKRSKSLKNYYSKEENLEKQRKIQKVSQFKRRKITATREELVELYWNKKKSIRQIAKIFGVHYNAVYDRFRRDKIPKMDSKTASKFNQGELTESGRKKISNTAKKTQKRIFEDPELKKERLERLKEMRKLITPETLKKIGKTQRALWKAPEYSKKMFKAFAVSPNKPETLVLNLIVNINSNFFYNKGEVNVDGKIPDFVNLKAKKILEVHGRAFHDPDFRSVVPKNIPYHRTKKGTEEHYTKNGYECLVVWDTDLGKKETLNEIEQFCISKHI